MSPKPRAAPFDLFSYGRVIARRIDNTPVAITLEYESTETTKAVIRVGRDKETSLAIKEQIRKTPIRQQVTIEGYKHQSHSRPLERPVLLSHRWALGVTGNPFRL